MSVRPCNGVCSVPFACNSCRCVRERLKGEVWVVLTFEGSSGLGTVTRINNGVFGEVAKKVCECPDEIPVVAAWKVGATYG